MRRAVTLASIALLLILPCSRVFAQQQAAPAEGAASHSVASEHPAEQPTPSESASTEQHVGTQGAAAEELSKTSAEAAGEEEDNAQFKHTAAVKWFARVTGLSEHAAYYVFIVLNFVVLALAIFMMARKSVPTAMRARTQSIRQQMEEAQRASAEANARLADVQGRLAKLDTEVAAMRSQTESDAAAEEDRIMKAVEEDKRKVVESADAEIAALTKAARRELKAYAAELAVAVAEKRIQVDQRTDEQLVRSFTAKLNSGKDGK